MKINLTQIEMWNLQQHRQRISSSLALHRSESHPLLPAQRKKAPLLPTTGSSLRALQLQERQRLPVAKQDHHFGRRLCFEWNLQLYHPSEGPFQVKDFLESNHLVVGAKTRHCLFGCHILFSFGLLDAWFHWLVRHIFYINSNNIIKKYVIKTY